MQFLKKDMIALELYVSKEIIFKRTSWGEVGNKTKFKISSLFFLVVFGFLFFFC